MSYEKPFLTTSDHAVGMQCVNRALDNNTALFFDYFEPGHATGRDPGDVLYGRGRHDDVLVARTVADFLYISDPLIMTGAPTLYAEVSGPLIVGSIVNIQAGQWKIRIGTPRIYSAVATIKGAVTATRSATCFVLIDSDSPYVIVSTWNVDSGALADYDFSLAIWSRGVL